MHSGQISAVLQPIVEVFCSYAHENKTYRDHLERHLSALKYLGYVKVWCDREIQPGTPWDQEIHAHLDTADLFLPLVSAHFLSSTYCWGVEMQRALERWNRGEVAIVPILVSPVDCRGTPISSLQMLPSSGKAITLWPDREQAYTDVAKEISKVVDTLRAQKWKLQGDASCNQELYDVALADYEEALRLDPENPSFHHARGIALLHLRRFEEAIAAYNTAIELKPDFGLAYKGKGDALNAFAPFAYEKYKLLAEQAYQRAHILEEKKTERRVNE